MRLRGVGTGRPPQVGWGSSGGGDGAAMVAQTVALGPEFDALPDDNQEGLAGTPLHQGAITALYTSLVLCGPRRGLPWFVGNQIKIVIPRQGHRAASTPYPDILVHPTVTNASRN